MMASTSKRRKSTIVKRSERNPRERARVAEAALVAAEAALRKGDGVLTGYREALAEANALIARIAVRCASMRVAMERAGLPTPEDDAGEFPF